jgi:arabinose-5-phosphate isomerase
MPSSHQAAALSAVQTFQQGFEALHTALSGPLAHSFSAAIEAILTTKGRLIVTGMGKSGHVGRKIAATMASTGTPAHFVHPAEASHGDLGMIQKDDVILALSWSGETAELANLVAYARRFKVLMIGLTAGESSALSMASDIKLILPRVEEACPNGLAPTTSTLLQLALGDAMAVALLKARGFSAQDFKEYHPGGKLGAQLQHVRDVMHKGEAIPLVTLASPMSEVIVTMSAKSFGCVGVCDDKGLMRGIITDGDLRRHMGPDLMSASAQDIMTTSPIVASPDWLAVDVLEKMNSAKITAMFVIENEAPAGLIHLHDLLRRGVA